MGLDAWLNRLFKKDDPKPVIPIYRLGDLTSDELYIIGVALQQLMISQEKSFERYGDIPERYVKFFRMTYNLYLESMTALTQSTIDQQNFDE